MKLNYSPEGKIRHAAARARQTREKHPRWKGRVMRRKYWYLFMPEHPNTTKQGYFAEHRYVMEQKIGRYLTSKEVVHHINHIPTDNRPENLALAATAGQHTKLFHPELADRKRILYKGKHFSRKTEFKKAMIPWDKK